MKKSALEAKTEELHIRSYRKHILLCADQTNPKCCPRERSIESWDYLKSRLRELELVDVEQGIYRSKVNCLRLCMQGPIMVVYPEAVWYRNCSPKIIERILQEHIIGGRVIEEFLIEQNQALAAFDHDTGLRSS